MSSTVVFSKVCNDKFKISIHEGYNNITIYKDRKYIEALIIYLKNVLNDTAQEFDVNSLTDEQIRQYFGL